MKKNLLLLSLAILSSLAMMAQSVTKFNGGTYNIPDYDAATQTFAAATYSGPQKIVFDTIGNGWVIEYGGNRIRVINPAQTYVYNRAGLTTGASGWANNPSGTNATFQNPSDIVINNKTGNFYIADAGNNCIRKLSQYFGVGNSQAVTTYAGMLHSTGALLDGASGVAKFNNPTGMAIDQYGNIYVADFNNNCIRIVSFFDSSVSVFAGSATGLPGSVDAVGKNASFFHPYALAWLSNTELVVTDQGNAKIRKINIITKTVSTIAGTGAPGNTDGDALTQATFSNPTGIVLDTNKNIYVTDFNLNVIRKICGSCVTTFAGSIGNSGSTNGNDTNARFNNPQGISFYKGALYVADNGNNFIRKVTIPGIAPDPIPVAKFSIQSDGNPNKTYNLIDSTTGFIFTGNQRWKITPGSYTYVSPTDSTSANAKIQFNAMTLYTITLTDANCWGKGLKTATINISNTGVNEVDAAKCISVYPNPTNGIFEISINTVEANSIRVMDINGKTILERKILSSKESIDMTGFAKGVYILNISGSEFSLNKKLIHE